MINEAKIFIQANPDDKEEEREKTQSNDYLFLPYAHHMINREESCTDWIHVFSCFEDDLFPEVKVKPSLVSAASWKEVYKSEAYWNKELVSSLVSKWYRAIYMKSVEEDYGCESWEIIYESEKEYESLCRSKGLVSNPIQGTWRMTSKNPYQQRDSSSDDEEWQPDTWYGCGNDEYDSDHDYESDFFGSETDDPRYYDQCDYR